MFGLYLLLVVVVSSAVGDVGRNTSQTGEMLWGTANLTGDYGPVTNMPQRITPALQQEAGLIAWISPASVELLGWVVGGLVGNLRAYFGQLRAQTGVVDQEVGDLLHTVDDSRVVAVTQEQADLLERELGVFA
jgi:hypothetical protein